MEEAAFTTKFASAQEKIQKAKGSYEFKTKEEVWGNIGTNPLDIAFTDLSELYMEVDDIHKKQIFEYAGIEGLPYDLWYFIRRVGQQIQSMNDAKWLDVGIAAALIDGARGDFRDLIISLTLLRFSAESHGVEIKPVFDAAIEDADERVKSILLNVRDDKPSNVKWTMKTFGVGSFGKKQKLTSKKKGFWGLFSK